MRGAMLRGQMQGCSPPLSGSARRPLGSGVSWPFVSLWDAAIMSAFSAV